MDSVLVSAEATGAALLLLLPPTAPAADCSCPSVDRRVAPAAGGKGVEEEVEEEEEEEEEEGEDAAPPNESSEFTAVKIDAVVALEAEPEVADRERVRRVLDTATTILLSTEEPWVLEEESPCRELIMPSATAPSTVGVDVLLTFSKMLPTVLRRLRDVTGLMPPEF